MGNRRRQIFRTVGEIQSGLDRQKWAENLIQQLPAEHDGRNSWLLNYGAGSEAQALREDRGIGFMPNFRAAGGAAALEDKDNG